MKTKSFTLLFTFFVIGIVCAQDSQQKRIDSLRLELSKAKTDTGRVMTLNRLSEHAGWRINENDVCINYAQKALALAQKIGFKDGMARSYNNMGNGLAQKLEREAALESYFEALKIFKETGNKYWEGRAYQNIAITYQNMADYPQAIKYYEAALKPTTEADDHFGIGGIYSGIGQVNMVQGDLTEALKNNSIAIDIYKKIGNKKEVVRVYQDIGAVYIYQGNASKALENYKNSLETAEDLNDKYYIANALTLIGDVYGYQGNYPEALSEFYKSLKIFEEINNKGGIGFSYLKIGQVYLSQGNYSDALKSFNIYLTIGKEMKNKERISFAYRMIADTYMQQNDFSNAFKNFSAALKVSKDIGSQQGIAYSNMGIGAVYYAQSDFTSSLKYYSDALKIFETIGDKAGMAFCNNGIGAVYIQLSQAEEGEKWLQKGLALHKETGAKDGIRDAYEYLSKADSALGNFNSAYENHKLFAVYKDSLINEANTQKLTETTMQYEFDKKEAATKALREKEKEKMKFRYGIIISAFFVIALTGFLLLYFTRMKKKKEKQIFLANRQIMELEKEKVEAELIQARKDVEQFLNKIEEKNQLINKIVNELKQLQETYDDRKSELGRTLTELRNTSILTDEDWSRFLSGFDKLYPEFIMKVRSIQPKITTSELRFLMLVKIGLSTKRMADTLGVSPNSVRVTWRRVKDKLNASEEDTPQSLLNKIENVTAEVY